MSSHASRSSSNIPFQSDLDLDFLHGFTAPPAVAGRPAIAVVDLFCGCGGLTVGLKEAARRLGIRLEAVTAVDSDPVAAAVYSANNPETDVLIEDAAVVISRAALPPADLLVGGPPCQGHSDLNNRTRRLDPKNELYLLMAHATEHVRPRMVVIENVPTVERDRSQVVFRTERALTAQGYRVAKAVVDASKLGVPQTRKRHLLLAYNDSVDESPHTTLSSLCALAIPTRSVRWALEDLPTWPSALTLLDSITKPSESTKRRIDYLFDHDIFELPNELRPPCHTQSHTYKSVYGRLHWDRPAQTITTGFTSMGQGRYVHPKARRVLTPREAARLQTFPDWFDWSEAPSRSALARLIGNAVPPLLATRIGEAILPLLSRGRIWTDQDHHPVLSEHRID